MKKGVFLWSCGCYKCQCLRDKQAIPVGEKENGEDQGGLEHKGKTEGDEGEEAATWECKPKSGQLFGWKNNPEMYPGFLYDILQFITANHICKNFKSTIWAGPTCGMLKPGLLSGALEQEVSGSTSVWILALFLLALDAWASSVCFLYQVFCYLSCKTSIWGPPHRVAVRILRSDVAGTGGTHGPGSATGMGRSSLLFGTWNDAWHIVGPREGLCFSSRWIIKWETPLE